MSTVAFRNDDPVIDEWLKKIPRRRRSRAIRDALHQAIIAGVAVSFALGPLIGTVGYSEVNDAKTSDVSQVTSLDLGYNYFEEE